MKKLPTCLAQIPSLCRSFKMSEVMFLESGRVRKWLATQVTTKRNPFMFGLV